MVICDTNIISELIRKNPDVVAKINHIGVENIVITPVIFIELMRWLSVYKGFTPSERKKWKDFFNKLPVIHLNQEISKLSIEISKKKDSLEPADILIGATGVYHKIPVYTLNKKHFKQINGISLY